MRYLIRRISPSIDRRWLVALAVVVALGIVASFLNWDRVAPPLELVALDEAGQFTTELTMPAEWADTAAASADVPVRFPLVLAVRNAGTRAATPQVLQLRLPVRYRLTGPNGEELPVRLDDGSLLAAYTLEPGLGPVEPGRLPAMLPAYERLWLEVVMPRYYCVALADSIPDFVPAPPPPAEALSELRVFYSFEGGDMAARRTGTLGVRLDASRLQVPMPETPPAFGMETNPERAAPDLGPLRYAGATQVRCGEPESPMEMLSTVWETEGGARFIALDYGGKVRKHLYDLNGDGRIDRESWDPDGDGRFAATRRASFPIPGFLLPRAPAATAYDMAAFDTIPAEDAARLDPLRRAMPGPGAVPGLAGEAPAVAPRTGIAARPAGTAPAAAAPAAAPAAAAPAREELPEPRIRAAQPLGRPVDPDG